MKTRCPFLYLMALSVLATPAYSSDPPTESEMLRVGRNWLRAYIEQNRVWTDSSLVLPEVAGVRPLVLGGTTIGAALLVRPGGMLVVPRTKNLSPIYAFSTTDS